MATGPDQECELKLLGSKEMRTAAALAERSGVAVLHASPRQRRRYERITRAHFEVQRLQFRKEEPSGNGITST